VNIQSPAVILVIDAGTLMESARIEVGADGPHGLALARGRLFCAADAGELVVIDVSAEQGHVTTRLPLRGAPDVVMHDDRTQRLYVAIGSPGVVTVFDTQSLTDVETVETELGAHTIGWDPVTARLYVFAPDRGGARVFSEAP
jgi:DNA-binding beta-propeller fold protein YncE